MSWRSELVIIDSWWLWQLHPFQPFRLIWTVFCGKTSGHQAFRWLQHIVEIHRLKNHGVSWMRCVQLLIVVVIVSPATWNYIWNTTNCCIGSKKAPIKYMHHMVLLQILHLYWDEILELPRSLFCPWDFADQIFRRRDLRWGKKMFRVQLQDFPDCSLCLSVVWKCLDVPGS